MDGDDLAESEPSEPPSLAEIFTKAFPYYLAMGMTYDEFWRGSPSLVRAYRQAHDLKRHERNYDLWLQGRYIFEALRCAPLLVGFPDKNYKPPAGSGYPDRPYPLTDKEAQEQAKQREEENFREYLRRMEAASEREMKRRKESQKEAVKDGGERD